MFGEAPAILPLEAKNKNYAPSFNFNQFNADLSTIAN